MALLFRLLGERGKLIAVLLISAAVIDNPCHFATPTQSCQEFQLVAGRDRYKDRDAALTPAAFLHRFREDRLLRGSCTPLFDTQLFFIFLLAHEAEAKNIGFDACEGCECHDLAVGGLAMLGDDVVGDFELAEDHPVVDRWHRQDKMSEIIFPVATFILLFVRFVFFSIAPKAKPFIKSRIELEARSKVSFEFCLLEFVPLG